MSKSWKKNPPKPTNSKTSKGYVLPLLGKKIDLSGIP